MKVHKKLGNSAPIRLVISLLIMSCLLGGTYIANRPVEAACASLPTDKGTVTTTASVPASSTYYIWSRNQTATASSNSYYLQIDNSSSSCYTVGDATLPVNTWTWVNYQDGNTNNRMSVSLSAGSHSFKMYGLDPSVQVDRLVLTTDANCTPSGTGDNCVNSTSTPVTVTPTSPSGGGDSASSGTIKVGGNADPNSTTYIKVDGKLVASGRGAVSLDTTKLSDGEHILVIETIDANGNKQVTLQRIVVKNHYTPWERMYNTLYNVLGQHRLLTNFAVALMVVTFIVTVVIAGYLAWFWRVWERIPGINKIHLKFLHVPEFMKRLVAKLPPLPRFSFLKHNPFDNLHMPAVTAAGGAGAPQVGNMHHSSNSFFEKFFSHPGARWMVVLAFALVGTFTALYSLADASAFVVEPERGTLSGVTSASDSTAAGGSYIRFGAGSCPAGQTGTPPSCTTPPPATCPAGQTGTPPNCTTPPPPSNPSTGGVSSCDPSKGLSGEQCWFDNTGVVNTFKTNGTRWHGSQIRANTLVDGHRPLEQLQQIGSQSSPQVVYIDQGGSAGNPVIYQNKAIYGCLAIRADYVTVRNVYVRGLDPGGGACTSRSYLGGGMVSSGDHVGITFEDSEVDGGYSDECSEPPYNQAACNDNARVGNMGMNIVFERKSRGDYLVQRVNSHGGYAFIGYVSGVRIRDSYLHDVGHMHKPCYPGCANTGDDYHMDIIWAQGQSNWSISHSFGLWTHAGWVNGHGSSGGCLCDNTSSNWVFDNVFMDGGDGYHGGNSDIASDGSHTKVVMQNVYAAGGRINQRPTAFSDYAPGGWTPAFAANGDPIITNSVCSGLYRGRTTMTKFGC